MVSQPLHRITEQRRRLSAKVASYNQRLKVFEEASEAILTNLWLTKVELAEIEEAERRYHCVHRLEPPNGRHAGWITRTVTLSRMWEDVRNWAGGLPLFCYFIRKRERHEDTPGRRDARQDRDNQPQDGEDHNVAA